MRSREPLGRVSIPTQMIAEARRLAQLEHATVAQVVRRALQKEIDSMHRTKLTGHQN